MGGVLGSGFGVLQSAWDWCAACARLLWACRLATADQVTAVVELVSAITAPIYVTAQQAVRLTAVNPRMRDHHYWRRIGQVAKAKNWSENLYRRVEANEVADNLLRASGSTATHMTRELAVEMAYHAYKERGH